MSTELGLNTEHHQMWLKKEEKKNYRMQKQSHIWELLLHLGKKKRMVFSISDDLLMKYWES